MAPARALLLLILVAGCDPGGRVEVTAQRVARYPRAVGAPTSDERFAPAEMLERASAQQVPGSAPLPDGAGQELPFRWETPAGWKAIPATPFRQLNFALPGDAECYLSVLPAGGGGLLANVNRWRSQLGQPPLDEAGVSALPRLTLLGNPAAWVELQGTYQGPGEPPRAGWAVLGLLMERDGGLVAVKLLGPSSAVAAQREGLLAFAASLRIEGQ